MSKAWKMTAKATLALVLAPAFGISPAFDPIPVVHAADASGHSITKENAIQLAKKWIPIPADYKQNNVLFQEEQRAPYFRQATWDLSWRSPQKDAGLYMTIDAETGELLQFSRYDSRAKTSVSAEGIGTEKALEKATEFLQRVTSDEERKKLSKPNEYSPLLPYFSEPSEHVFMFTRIENKLPFLENGFQIVVDRAGDIRSFTKEWSKGDLPAPNPIMSAERAENLVRKLAAPSLVYKELSRITGSHDRDQGKYLLVYAYGQNDPQFVEAISGKIINALGKAEGRQPVQALGTTISKQDKKQKRITKEEAGKIAEQLIKKMPGEYRSEGSRGGGASSGPDGVEIRNWKFDFTPLQSKDKSADKVQLRIDDRGELEEFSRNERDPFGEAGRKMEQAVSWKEAEASAIQLVKTFYSDRLGEIYLLDEPPSDAYIKEQLENGRMFEVEFGWMKDGVPVENAEFTVEVNPETGVAETMQARGSELSGLLAIGETKAIDLAAAKKAEQAQKKWMLTYYQPETGNRDLPVSNVDPMLVYRYVGDRGVVDAATGKWISFEQERKKLQPQDLAGHPQQEALEFAIRMGFMTAEEGKLEPDKQVTRGEMAQLMARLTNRIEYHTSLSSRLDDEEAERFLFADVNEQHPQYAVIQKGIQYGFITKDGTRFEPDKAITRAQAADMVARLLGYGDLLNKSGIFVSAYSDVQQKDSPAVTIVHALGLLPSKDSQSFHPNDPMTRAEAALLMKALLELRQSEE